ncbi:hypothetical protein [Caballeronia sp. NCTM1]|uniref:hypothetical protein n=1 Tax=Caballeronia sp. NCTM1 TaxID=2921753 RepID=UPI002028A848|nr:hypothetical protein [Caballeronia sp. NCTM1]
MFGSERRKAKDVTRRGTLAIMTGAYLHHSQVATYGLNDDASSWLYSESVVHLISVLGMLFKASFMRKYAWATPEFFLDSVAKALAESDASLGLRPNTTFSLVFTRLIEMEKFTDAELSRGDHFADSALRIEKQDQRADKLTVEKVLRTAADRYFADAQKLFVSV